MPSRVFSSDPYGDEARPEQLRIDLSYPDADTVVMTPSGEADVFTAPALMRALSDAIVMDRPQVIVDLDRLTFMDATTLDALVAARKRACDKGGSLVLRCTTRQGRRLLSITGLDVMVDDRSEAIGSPPGI